MAGGDRNWQIDKICRIGSSAVGIQLIDLEADWRGLQAGTGIASSWVSHVVSGEKEG
jgi:hypothetical protein